MTSSARASPTHRDEVPLAPEQLGVMGQVVRRVWIALPPPEIEIRRRNPRPLGEDAHLHE